MGRGVASRHRGQDVEARRLARGGMSIAEIEHTLEERYGSSAARERGLEPADRRAIVRWVRDVVPYVDRSGRWSWMDASPGEAAVVAPLLARLRDMSSGFLPPEPVTRAQVGELLRVLAIAPDLLPFEAWSLARSLLVARADGDRAVMDEVEGYLVWAPWRSDEHAAEYDRVVREGVAPLSGVTMHTMGWAIRLGRRPEPSLLDSDDYRRAAGLSLVK